MESTKLTITNPERINRVLQRICSASLQVLLRVNERRSVAVRGRATQLILSPALSGMRIANISVQGMHHLAKYPVVRVEFVGMSTQIVFESQILHRHDNSIILSLPKVLQGLERRQNHRVITTDRLAAFLTLSMWRADESDAASPPVFGHLKELASRLKVVDISETGVCIVTRFPGVMSSIAYGVIDDHATLHLPMEVPHKVSVEVRWLKRIKETLERDAASVDQRYLRFGIFFINPSSEMIVSIRQYMKSLSVADAI